jgi:hypothetical protein
MMGWMMQNERRLRMIMQGQVALSLPRAGLAALGVLALALAPGWAQSSPATGRAKFTLSKETTVITAPLNPDGTPDYVTAMNDLCSKDVTPENNGFTRWIEIVGTRTEDGILAPRAVDRVLAMCGAKPTPAGAEVWKGFNEYLQEQKVEGQRAGTLEDEMLRARRELWTAQQHPEFAAYLKLNDKWLDEIAKAAARPQWWSPGVCAQEQERKVMMSVLLPSLGRLRDAGNVLAARATQRAAAGDFAGFRADVVAVKRLGRHSSMGPTLIEKLVGAAINHVADDALGTVVGPGRLTEAQCVLLQQSLGQLPAPGRMEDAIAIEEKWLLLDMVLYTMTAENTDRLVDVLAPSGDGKDQIQKQFGPVELQAVDLDVILRQVNQTYDELVGGGDNQTLGEVRKRGASLDAELQKWVRERNASRDLSKRPEETRAAYSARVGRAFMSVMMPSLSRAMELAGREIAADAAANVLLAAAREKARTGKWPETLEQMVPGTLREVPADWFSEDGKSPLKYGVTAQGAKVYSVGRNGRDDGGKTGTGQEDDIVVGW